MALMTKALVCMVKKGDRITMPVWEGDTIVRHVSYYVATVHDRKDGQSFQMLTDTNGLDHWIGMNAPIDIYRP